MNNWALKFSHPIEKKDGVPLETLGDARVFLIAMPWQFVRRRHWLAATEAILAASKSGDLNEAEAALLSAIRIESEPRKSFIPPSDLFDGLLRDGQLTTIHDPAQ
jgi:hypothetical protein